MAEPSDPVGSTPLRRGPFRMHTSDLAALLVFPTPSLRPLALTRPRTNPHPRGNPGCPHFGLARPRRELGRIVMSVVAAQTMRAIRLASATATTLRGLRSSTLANHGSFVLPRRTAHEISAMAPAIKSRLRPRWPIFDILPSLGLPPVVCCFGTSPSQAAKSRPRRKLSMRPQSPSRPATARSPARVVCSPVPNAV